VSDAGKSKSTQFSRAWDVRIDWQSVIKPHDIVGFGGDVPLRIMALIEMTLRERPLGPASET
jgi:hypothetical protein